MKYLPLLLSLIFFSFSANASSSGVNAAKEVCASATYHSERVQCLEDIRGKDFSKGAAEVCGMATYFSERKSCLLQIADKYLNSHAMKICKSATYFSEKLSCMEQLENLVFDREDVEICSRATYLSQRLQCMLQIGVPYEEPSEDSILQKLKKSRRAINNENYQQAKRILSDLILDIEENGSGFCK